jgi:hypothetical protein
MLSFILFAKDIIIGQIKLLFPNLSNNFFDLLLIQAAQLPIAVDNGDTDVENDFVFADSCL